MKFKKITVKCSSETSDAVAYALHEAGSMGEVYDDYNDIKQVLAEKRWDYADESLFEPTDACAVSGYFTAEIEEQLIFDRINELKKLDYADFGCISASSELIDSVEWENEWKKYYKPFNIGRLVVIPQWVKYTPTCGDIPIYLDPGLAFGTGTHETTSMCMELMQKLDLKDKRVLDFGCGSGILGICANALGAKETVFVDTDEQAITATENNCKLNGMTAPDVFLRDVRQMNEKADVIVANITADILIEVEPIIRSALKKGGAVIISGIISARADSVVAAYKKDFTLAESERKNEWSAYIFTL
ncbi:MAG: 50S ribosomal protein L11 methyltransferase [Clostridia bacterium]|nr:50S ribosomal protein L11 methyltransferase [Clostridia bacterium]